MSGFEARPEPEVQASFPADPMEIAKGPTKTPEQKVGELTVKKLGEYEARVRDSKDSKEAEGKVKEATDALNNALKALALKGGQLPDGYKNEYKDIFSWTNRTKIKMPNGCSWSVIVEKVDGQLKASYELSDAWNSTIGSFND